MISVGVVGCGYWGPNLVRNFAAQDGVELRWACDVDPARLQKALSGYPAVRRSTDLRELLQDPSLDAVAVATPAATHYGVASACLAAGKHVLVEKPLAASFDQGRQLVRIARDKGLTLMCDHIFCYTGAIVKIKEMIDAAVLGDVLYFDSVRVNLGLLQSDINVVWDLAPHDLSILDFLFGRTPETVSAHGACHAGTGLETIAYLTLRYSDDFIAHCHLNWLSPVKIRQTIIGGSERMLVWNDLEPAEKIKVYDKGITWRPDLREDIERLRVSYRSGDMFAPKVDHTEALARVVAEFTASVVEKRPPLTDGDSGLRVLRILEAAQNSLRCGGSSIPVAGGGEG